MLKGLLKMFHRQQCSKAPDPLEASVKQASERNQRAATNLALLLDSNKNKDEMDKVFSNFLGNL